MTFGIDKKNQVKSKTFIVRVIEIDKLQIGKIKQTKSHAVNKSEIFDLRVQPKMRKGKIRDRKMKMCALSRKEHLMRIIPFFD